MTDRVDHALQTLRAQRWPGDTRNARIEHAILTACPSRRPWIAGLACLLVGAGIVAAGVASGIGYASLWRDQPPPTRTTDVDTPDDEFDGGVELADN